MARRRSSTKKRLSFVDKLHACKNCETCFVRRSHLDIHMRTHIEEARRLSAIEAELHQNDASPPALPEDTKKPSADLESVKRRSPPHDDGQASKRLSKVAAPAIKKARKSLEKDAVEAHKSAGKAVGRRIGSASLSMGWRCAKLKLAHRTKTIRGTAVTVYA